MSAISTAACQTANFVKAHAPTIATPDQIMRNVQKLALPAIALAAMASLPGADSGPVAWAACVVACEGVAIAAAALTGGILTPVAAASLVTCTNVCWFAMAAPVP